MKILLLARSDLHHKWGGDLFAIQGLYKGLCELGHTVEILSSALEITHADCAILFNSVLDLRNEKKILDLFSIPYTIIPFHEDALEFFGPSMGLYSYVRNCLDKKDDLSIEQLEQMPHLIHYYAPPLRRNALYNFEVLRDAKICFANTQKEERTLRRDCPSCQTQVIPLFPGLSEDFRNSPTSEFINWLGLCSQDYLLQVGRIEPRKNQLGTILATRDLDLPLVLIATRTASFYREYEKTCLEAIVKWRRAPTWIISQHLPPLETPLLKIVPMPGENKLPITTLQSAFAHAKALIHPAFCEQPGYTYFESLTVGTPIIASSWVGAREYLSGFEHHATYPNPFILKEIRESILKIGQKFTPNLSHPSLTRSYLDMAQDISTTLKNILK